jgi:hypothetical protein
MNHASQRYTLAADGQATGFDQGDPNLLKFKSVGELIR